MKFLAIIVPHYVPASDNCKDVALTGPLATLEPIVFIWCIAMWALVIALIYDINGQDKERHTIEAIVLIVTGLILVALAAHFS